MEGYNSSIFVSQKIDKAKIVFVGNQSVGKTSIIMRSFNNTFTEDYTI